MSIEIVSTSDSDEAVTAALGDLAKPVVEAQSTDLGGEATEESEVSADAEKDDAETEKSDDKPKKKNGFKKKIEKLNGQLTLKEQEAEYWKQQALKGQMPKDPESKSNPAKAQADGKPKKEDFETHDDYVEALTDWKVDRKALEIESKQRETQTKSEFQKRVDSHQARVADFVTKHPDFQDVVEEVDDVPMSLGVQETLLSSEHGPALMYELAKSRDEFVRICKLPPLEAAREIGKIEARLDKPIETKTTKTPAPIKPLKSSSTGSGKKSIDDPNLSQREYEKLRKEQLAQRRA